MSDKMTWEDVVMELAGMAWVICREDECIGQCPAEGVNCKGGYPSKGTCFETIMAWAKEQVENEHP